MTSIGVFWGFVIGLIGGGIPGAIVGAVVGFFLSAAFSGEFSSNEENSEKSRNNNQQKDNLQESEIRKDFLDKATSIDYDISLSDIEGEFCQNTQKETQRVNCNPIEDKSLVVERNDSEKGTGISSCQCVDDKKNFEVNIEREDCTKIEDIFEPIISDEENDLEKASFESNVIPENEENSFVKYIEDNLIIENEGFSNENKYKIEVIEYTECPSNIEDILISQQVWDTLKLKRKKLASIINSIDNWLSNPHFHSNRIRLVSSKKIYKIRFDKSQRLIFSINKMESGCFMLKLYEILSHEEAEEAHKKGFSSSTNEEFRHLVVTEERGDVTAYQKAVFRHLNVSYFDILFAENKELPWYLSEEQRQLVNLNHRPILLKGRAGSGKTTIAIFKLCIMPELNKRLFVTFTKSLADYAKREFRKLKPINLKGETDFLTISELCKRFVKDSKFDEKKKVTLERFKNLPFVSGQKFEPEMVWEEIRGVIKGAFQIEDSSLGYLALDEYLSIPKKQSLFGKEERKKIYRVFQSYQNWKEKKDMWDDLDLSFNAYKNFKLLDEKEKRKYMFDQVVVDEVQDFTSFQIKLVLDLSGHLENLFITGDAQQIIFPSRFEWIRVKDLIYEEFKRRNLPDYLRKETLSKIHEFSANFRSVPAIVNLQNRLNGWRKEVLNDTSKDLISMINSNEKIYLLRNNVYEWLTKNKNEKLTAKLMVIVFSEEMKKKAESFFPKARIFTVFEAKGLESDYSVVFNFFSDPVLKFGRIEKLTDYSKAFLFNVLTVAISRAKKKLFFLDTINPFEKFPKLKINDISDNGVSFDMFKNVFEEKSSNEEFIAFAKECEEKELISKAAENYLAGDDLKNANRCFGMYFEKMAGDTNNKKLFERAGEHYFEADMIYKAVECFEKAENYRKAFEFLLSDNLTGKKERETIIKDYVTDLKKIARIGLFGRKLVSTHLMDSKSVPFDFVFDYFLNREKVLDSFMQAIIKSGVESIKTQSSDINLLVKRAERIFGGKYE